MNQRSIFISATILAGLGVALGAFGAHALKEFLAQHGRTDTFETAVRYQLFHSMALFVVGLLSDETPKKLRWVGWLFLIGTVFFSGSLYALSTTSFRWVVYFTPIGGATMTAGWVVLLLYFITDFGHSTRKSLP
jgi:uncharacterized membrane protein YgdD (TMEM256/DUF423 family)